MKQVFNLTLAILILALFALPIMAQDSTAEPSPTAETLEQAPVVVVDDSAEFISTIESQFASLIMVIAVVSIFWNIVQSFLLYKSVPRELSDKLIARGELYVKTTPSPDDDKVMAALRMAYDKLTQAEIDARS